MPTKLKRIGRSKLPLAHQLSNMSENLRSKFNQAVYVEVKCWDFNDNDGPKLTYSLYMESFDSSDTYTSWPDLLNEYFRLMRS